MSIQSRYRHTLVIKRMVATGAVDGLGLPVMAETTFATVKGLIQPRSARDLALVTEAVVLLGTLVGYIDPLPGLTTHDWIEMGGERYDVLSITDPGGIGHHLELGLQKVG